MQNCFQLFRERQVEWCALGMGREESILQVAPLEPCMCLDRTAGLSVSERVRDVCVGLAQ